MKEIPPPQYLLVLLRSRLPKQYRCRSQKKHDKFTLKIDGPTISADVSMELIERANQSVWGKSRVFIVPRNGPAGLDLAEFRNFIAALDAAEFIMMQFEEDE
jgi:hypothetical protein